MVLNHRNLRATLMGFNKQGVFFLRRVNLGDRYEEPIDGYIWDVHHQYSTNTGMQENQIFGQSNMMCNNWETVRLGSNPPGIPCSALDLWIFLLGSFSCFFGIGRIF